MVEIRSQENGAVKLPNNIRQVGIPGEKIKIYIEDYVMTYLNQIAGQKPFGQKAALLLGETVEQEKMNVFFISAAVQIESLDIREDNLQMTTEIWSDLYEKIEKYFKEKCILGWFLSRPGQSVGVNDRIEKVQTESFGDKGVLFYTMDTLDREEAFYLYERGHLIRQQGYYIYYERNEAMQNYMIAIRQDEAGDDGGEVSGFQNRLFERKADHQVKKDAYQYDRHKGRKWLPQAASLLVLLLIIMSVRKKILVESMPVSQPVAETIAAESSQQGNLDIVESILQQTTESIYNETQTEMSTDETEDTITDAEAAVNAHQSYTVQEGDTLLKISRKFYQDASHVEQIIQMNQIEDPDYIYPGMVLQLPEATVDD